MASREAYHWREASTACALGCLQVFGPASRKRASAFAVLDHSGASDQFKALLRLAEEGRAAWQAQRAGGTAAAAVAEAGAQQVPGSG